MNHVAKVDRSVRHPCIGNKKILAANEDNNVKVAMAASLLRKEKAMVSPSKSKQMLLGIKDFLKGYLHGLILMPSSQGV